MFISRNILIAASLAVVALQAACAPASATTSTVSMTVGITIIAPSAAHAGNYGSMAGKASIAKPHAGAIAASSGISATGTNGAIQPEVTTAQIEGAGAQWSVQTLNY